MTLNKREEEKNLQGNSLRTSYNENEEKKPKDQKVFAFETLYLL